MRLVEKFFVIVALVLGGCAVIAAAEPSHALAASKIISISIDNPNGPLKSSTVSFSIPFGLAPINLTDAMNWNSSARRLEINLGPFTTKESKTVIFAIEGDLGNYLVSGEITGIWPKTNLLPEESFKGTIDPFVVLIEPEGSQCSVLEFLDNLRRDPRVAGPMAKIAQPVSVALGAVGTAAAAANAFMTSPALLAELSRLFSLLGFGMFRLKKRKPWGRVYDRLTDNPIYGAVVKIFDSKYKLAKETQTTDKEGRFGFLVSPGEYYIRITRSGYEDYQSQLIKISQPDQSLILDVPMVVSGATVKHPIINTLKLKQQLRDTFYVSGLALTVIGSLISLAVALIVPSILNYGIVLVYLILWVFRIGMAHEHVKSFGKVLDKSTNKPVDLAVVRLFSADQSWLLETRVTDASGKFRFLVNHGGYYVTAVREGYGSFQSAPLELKKSDVFAHDIKIERA